MRLNRALFVVVMMFASANACATQIERQTLVADFSHVLGIETLITSSLQQTRQVTISQRTMVLDNLRRAGLSDAALQQVQEGFDKVIDQVMTSWTPEEASRIYTTAIADSMSDDDLKKSIAFYHSSEGQKSLSAANEAGRKLQEYIQGSMTKAMEPALKEFMEQVRAIAAAERKKQTEPAK